MTEGFIFGGRSTQEFDMHVESYPAQNGAARKREVISVPGRNGDLHIVQNAFENYTQTYACYFHGRKPSPEVAHAIKGWLLGSGGYQRLEDHYDPDHFRLASFAGPLDVENILNQFGRCVVNFDCAPQSFLKIGEFPVNFVNPGNIFNPTAFTSLPMIHIYGTGAGTVTVGGTVVTVHEVDGELILDCEMQNCYIDGGEGAPQNKNSSIYAPEFPTLAPGLNPVGWTGDITAVKIIPRWWEL